MATRARKRSVSPQFPQWFPDSARNQSIAELLSFHFWLDRLVGIEPHEDRKPYSHFNPSAVVPFLARLRKDTDGHSPAPRDTA
jgi:hypothetical protein